HAWAPTLVKAIQKASQENDKESYEQYREMVRQQPLTAIRDLLELKPLGPAIPVEEVESAEAITARFIVTAMSLGSLSPE
ncbi:glutamate synthase-related protein, partial [Salmonella enterica]|uniref:glutamate synthase-related protein n=1 Tax=Salmonella enterica TaxID=28901 RepID=UPI003FD88972